MLICHCVSNDCKNCPRWKEYYASDSSKEGK